MKYLIILCILTSGCASSTLVRKQYEPVRGGTVQYLNEGAGFVINSRIKDAKQKMWAFCGGEYKITAEGSNSKPGTVLAGGYVVNSDYELIEFECL